MHCALSRFLDKREMLMPVARDINAAGDPDLLVAQKIGDEALQGGSATRPSGQTAMKADRHHLRRASCTFREEQVEGVLEISEKLIARIEALGGGKAHVIGIERVGDDEMRTAWARYPIGQIVGVGIR